MTQPFFTAEEWEAADESKRKRQELLVEGEKAQVRNIADVRAREQAPHRAEALQLERRTGVPFATVERNMDEMRARDAWQQLGPESVEYSPAWRKLLNSNIAPIVMQNPASTRAIADAINFRTVGSPQQGALGAGIDQGNWMTEVAKLGWRVKFGLGSDADEVNFNQMRRNPPEVPDAPGYLDDVGVMIASQIPVQGSILAYGTTAAAGGAALGGTFGGPPLAAATGGSMFVVGTAFASYHLEGGLAYAEMLGEAERVFSETGEVIPHGAIVGASELVGVVNGALEFLSFGVMTRNPFVAGLKRKLSAKAGLDIIKSKTLRPYLIAFGKRMAVSAGTEASTEFGQEQVLMGAVQALIASTTSLQAQVPEDWSERSLKSFLSGFIVGPAMTIAVSPYHAAVMRVGINKQTLAHAKRLDAITAARLADGGLADADPQAVREWIQGQIEEGGGDPNLYLPADKIAELFQEDETLAESLPEVAEQLAEAQVAGTDVVIPISDYATYLAVHHDKLREFVRHGLGERNTSEAEANSAEDEANLRTELEALAGTEEGAVEPTPGERVEQSMIEKLIRTASASPEAAARLAELLKHHAERRASDPAVGERAFEEADIGIEGPLGAQAGPGVAADVGQPVDLESMLDELRGTAPEAAPAAPAAEAAPAEEGAAKAKKAENARRLAKRKQFVANNRPRNEGETDFEGPRVGDKYDGQGEEDVPLFADFERGPNFDPGNDGRYSAIVTIKKPQVGSWSESTQSWSSESGKPAKVTVMIFNNKADADAYIAKQWSKRLELVEKAEAKWGEAAEAAPGPPAAASPESAELAAMLEQLGFDLEQMTNEEVIEALGDRFALTTLDQPVGAEDAPAKPVKIRAFHGTASESGIDVFRPLTHFGTARAAAERLKDDAGRREFEGEEPGRERTIPVELNIQNPLRINDQFDPDTPVNEVISDGAIDAGVFTFDERDAVDAAPDPKTALISLLERKGYDGIVYTNAIEDEGSDSFIIFRPEQVTSAISPDANTLYQPVELENERPLAGAFHSTLGRVLRESPQRKMTVAQVRKMLQKKSVKKDEVIWSGVEEYLSALGPQDKVDLDQMMEVIKLITVEEVVLGGLDPLEVMDEELTRWFDDNGLEHFLNVEDALLQEGLTDEQRTWLNDFDARWDATTTESFDTQNATYVLDGGTDYRETLITLPPKTIPEELDKLLKAKQDSLRSFVEVREVPSSAPTGEFGAYEPTGEVEYYQVDARGNFGERVFSTREEAEAELSKERFSDADKARLEELRSEASTFTGGHYGDTAPNVLVHIRWNTRVGPNGEKVLFIEEIQDDWAKAGRKEGYSGDYAAFREQILKAARKHHYVTLGNISIEEVEAAIYELERDPLTESNPKAEAAWLLLNEFRFDFDLNAFHDINDSSVPDRPFKTTGHVLALKRMIALAISEGFDSVAWTPGHVQVERYESELRQTVDSIQWDVVIDPVSEVFTALTGPITTKDAKEITVSTLKDGEVGLEMQVDPESGLVKGSTAGDAIAADTPLEDVVGKDIARQILEGGPTGTVEGDNLTIGGKGFTDIYDTKLVKAANKLGKKYGAKVETATVEVGESRTGPRQEDVDRLENLVRMGAGPNAEADLATQRAALAASSEETQHEQVHTLNLTPEMKSAVGQEGLPLFSEGDKGIRGSLSYNNELTNVIMRFTKSKNLSTGLHESAHLFFAMMLKDARTEGIAPQLMADMQTALDFLGMDSVESLLQDSQGNLSDEARAAHEKWARAFEVYLREGKAPSAALRESFSRFKSWLLHLYKTLRGLNVELNPEMRQVFDRLLASDEQIAQAKQHDRMLPAFESAEAGEMTPAQFAAYEKSYERMDMKAQEELGKKVMREFDRELTAEWKENWEKMQAEVEAEINADPIVQLRHWLQMKTLLNEETPEEMEHIRLDLDIIKERYGGKSTVKALGGTGAYSMVQKDGMDPELLAPQLGFESGQEVVDALVATTNRKLSIKIETDKRMKETYGDILNDGTMSELAIDALESDAKGDFLIRQQRILGHRAGIANNIPQAIARDVAREVVQGKQIRSLRPDLYRNAEARAVTELLGAVESGDWQAAHEAGRKQLLNHFLAVAAVKAKEQTTKWHGYTKTFDKKAKRERLARAGEDHLDQIDSLLERFDLRQMSNKKADLALADWVQARIDAAKERNDELGGVLVAAPAFVINDQMLDREFRQHWRTMTVSEMGGLVDAVKNIEHLAMTELKLLLERDRLDFETRVEQFLETANANQRTDKPISIETGNQLKEQHRLSVGAYFASHRKLASLLSEMGGGYDSVLFDMIIRPMDEAGNKENSMRIEAGQRLGELFAPYMGDLTQKFKRTAETATLGLVDVVIPDIAKQEKVPGTGSNVRPMSKIARLMAVLNMGNAGNLQRLTDGYGWSQSDALAILDTLTKEDMDFVQGVWDYIEEYWGDVSDLQRRIAGVAPKKIQRQALTTRHGTYAGGYFPVKYDSSQTPQAWQDSVVDAARNTMSTVRGKAKTQDSFTKQRVRKVVDRQIQLDFGVIFGHVGDVVHRLAWQEWLMDTGRLLADKRIAGAIMQGYGVPVYRTMVKAHEDIASGDVPAEKGWEQAVNWMRKGSSIAGMGLSITTALYQPFGLTQSMVRIGPKWVGRGIAKWWRGPEAMNNTVEWIYSLSPMMKNRGTVATSDMNREIREVQSDLTEGGVLTPATKSYFYLIVKAQILADVPTWLGAYEKEMEIGSGDESRAIAMADRAVIDAQGGGQIQDQAAIQRGGPLLKAWTNFYSFFNTTWNNTVESYRRTDFRKPDEFGKFLVDMLLLYTIPAVLSDMMQDAIMGTRDDDDDEGFLEYAIRSQVGYMLNTLVGVRELGGIATGYMDWSGPAGVRGFEAANNLGKQIGQGEADAALFKAMVHAAGIFFHLPSVAIMRAVEGGEALIEGETSNPAALLLGAPRSN